MYSLTFGSFLRGGNYPLEADYIFSSVEELQQWCDELNGIEDGGILHDGLLKIVKEEENQTLYWCYNRLFYPLIDINTFENLDNLHKFIKEFKCIRGFIEDVERRLKNTTKSIQEELDLTQLSIGLNGNGSFDTVNMSDTNYLTGATSIISCLKALDKALSQVEIDAFITDAGYDDDNEKLFFVFKTKQDPNKRVEIDVHSLIEEWEVKDSSTIILSKDRHISGKSTLTADVRVVVNKNNILEKTEEGLLVKGTSDNITHNGLNLKDFLATLSSQGILIFETYPLEINLPEGSLFLVQEGLQKGLYIVTTNKVEKIPFNEELLEKFSEFNTALEDYLTKLEASETYLPIGDYLTEHQSLDEYAKSADVTEEINDAIDNLDIDLYETIEGAADKYQPKGEYLTEHLSLEHLVTKEEFNPLKDKVDALELKGYDDSELRQSISDLQANKADKSELEDYATELWVEDKHYLTEVPEEYAKKEDITSAISASEAKIFGDGELAEAFDTIQEIGAYLKDNDHNVTEAINSAISTKADKSEIEDMATQTWVNDLQYLTEHQSLDNYYTKSEVDSKFLDYNNFEYVDLGLPSGNLWATCNIGASKPEEIGLYFAWGEILGYRNASGHSFEEENYKFYTDKGYTKYNKEDNLKTLELEDDAAHINMQGGWAIPSPDDFQELLDYTESGTTLNSIGYVSDYNGVKGLLRKSKVNNNTIFLPAAGIFGSTISMNNSGSYWSSDIYDDLSFSSGHCLIFTSLESFAKSHWVRYTGQPIRAVLKYPEKYITKKDYQSNAVKVWKGSQEDYNQLGSYNDNTFYLIKDEG